MVKCFILYICICTSEYSFWEEESEEDEQDDEGYDEGEEGEDFGLIVRISHFPVFDTNPYLNQITLQ